MTKPGGKMLGQVDPTSSMTQGGISPPPPIGDIPQPFLPRSENAARFISRSSKIDPRYVDLELVGIRRRRQRSLRRVGLFCAGVLVVVGGLAGGAWVLFNDLQPSEDQFGRAVSRDPGTASHAAVGVRDRSNYPDGRNLAAVQQHVLAMESVAKTLPHVGPSPEPLGTAAGSGVEVASETQGLASEEDGVDVDPSGATDVGDDVSPTVLRDAGPGLVIMPTRAFEPTVEVAAVPSVVNSRLAISGLSSIELLAEGQRLLKVGDVKAARLYFANAAEKGLARAALAMGSTYDQKALSANGIANVKSDQSKALSWYRRAHVLAERTRGR